MHTVERELLKVTKTQKTVYKDRQALLAALVRKVEKLSDDAYEGLSDDAYEWCMAAAKALNKHEKIKDFDGTVETPQPAADTEGDQAGSADPDTGSEDQELASSETSIEPAEGEVTVDAVESTGTEKLKPLNKYKKKGEKRDPRYTATGAVFENRAEQYERITGKRDRYGIIIGTKTYDAVKMYEQGATLLEVSNKLGGGRFYNILTKLAKDGHHVEKKMPGAKWYVMHKDDAKGRDPEWQSPGWKNPRSGPRKKRKPKKIPTYITPEDLDKY